ncbi:MAG: hypothetical protein HN348_34945, partial [Proteobacteria bacterium]|nr:hypothetical protein [Pseudomonadota bacterium]
MQLPKRIEEAILGCIVVNPDARLASCEELLQVLDQDGGAPKEVWSPETRRKVGELTIEPAPVAELEEPSSRLTPGPTSETAALDTIHLDEPRGLLASLDTALFSHLR